MRNSLPSKINFNESGVVNLDSKENMGTHWTCYKKAGRIINYFDSFGNLKPPRELIRYFRSDNKNNIINYNYTRKQKFNSVNCGQLCMNFISK